MDKVTGVVITGALFIGAALVYGIATSAKGIDASTAPLITTVLGFVGLFITQAFTAGRAAKAENLSAKAREIGQDTNDKLTNGFLEDRIDKGVTSGINHANIRDTP